MTNDMPRLENVEVKGPLSIRVRWIGGETSTIKLAGWIATGGAVLASIGDAAMFATAHIAKYGTSVAWGDGDELMIDAEHLWRLAVEQKPINVSEWQEETSLSNQEAADLIGVSLSTWNAYKAKGNVPLHVGIALRAALRDPLVLQAHYRPRKNGRPRKALAA